MGRIILKLEKKAGLQYVGSLQMAHDIGEQNILFTKVPYIQLLNEMIGYELTSDRMCANGSFNTGSSKKMDGIWNRYNLKSHPLPQHVHMTHHRREHRPSVSRSPTCGSRVNDERLRFLN